MDEIQKVRLRDLPRTVIPLSPQVGILGLPALRAGFGTDVVIASETVLTGSDELVLPPTLEQLIDDLAAPGHGVILAMGKGGVGKTTVAAAVAVALAERGFRVHLSTTDPAAQICRRRLTATRCRISRSVGLIPPEKPPGIPSR